jgi:hypothetical protein
MPAKKTPKAENLEIVVRYTCDGGALSGEQKLKLIKNIKKEHYYHDYLSGVFRYAFVDSESNTIATYLWKGAAGDTHEAGDRVLGMLTGDYYETLPEGVKAKLIGTNEVSYKSIPA